MYVVTRFGDVTAPQPWIPIDVDVPVTNIDTGYNNSSTSLMTASDGDNDSIRMLTYEDSTKITAVPPTTTTTTTTNVGAGIAGVASESSEYTETGIGVGVEGSLMTTSSMTEVHYWHVTAQAQLPVRLLTN